MGKSEQQLTERREGDRKKMAACLVTEITAAGATAIAEPCSYKRKRLDVEINAPGGACITVDFDGDSSQPNVYVVTWNTRYQGVFFNPDIDDVNPYHFGKATRVCEGFASLVKTLKRDVARFVDGSGYLAHSDPRIVAMRERYHERGWTWFDEAAS